MAASDVTAQQLCARGVGVRFEGLVALDEVDLTLARGEIVGLIGPNGAGKTTLVNVLNGFQAPAAGGVFIDGAEVTGWPPHQLARAGLGRTFQSVRLFRDLTVGENVELGAVGCNVPGREAQRRAAELLDWFGLADKAGVAAGTLPFGDERWVGLARAMAGGPAFLLLDEPAAGLNEAESERLVQTVARIRDEFGCGVLLIEHNMQLVMALTDRIHVLENGRTIAEGTPAEVQADPEVRRAYLGGEERTAGGQRATPLRAAGSLIEVDKLAVRYGPVQALRGVSLSVGEGELISVIGPNGAGKSTLLQTVAGLVRPTNGRVAYRGDSLVGRAPERIVADGISLVPEGRHVFAALTVQENLIAGATASGGMRRAADELERLLALFPILRERYTQPAGKLSGGEQQQLAIARAMLARPRLLLLDEPSLGLAPLVIDQLFETLAAMRDDGLTILLVEQNAARALSVSDRTYVLRNGRIMLEGPAAELAGDPRFDEAYFGFRAAS
jgi:ABC-type branched-subunit amino acid transport system ATPase component